MWAAFLRSQAQAIIAADVLQTRTLTRAPLYVFAVIEHATRRVHISGATAHPTATWTTQPARNLVTDLQDAGATARYPIPDRDSKHATTFDAVLQDQRIAITKTGVRVPCMNAIMERWVRSCRAELLDRTLILKPSPPATRAPRIRDLLQPTPDPPRASHPGPQRLLPQPITERTSSTTSTSDDAIDSAASSTSTNTLPELHGRGFRHVQDSVA